MCSRKSNSTKRRLKIWEDSLKVRTIFKRLWPSRTNKRTRSAFCVSCKKNLNHCWKFSVSRKKPCKSCKLMASTTPRLASWVTNCAPQKTICADCSKSIVKMKNRWKLNMKRSFCSKTSVAKWDSLSRRKSEKSWPTSNTRSKLRSWRTQTAATTPRKTLSNSNSNCLRKKKSRLQMRGDWNRRLGRVRDLSKI